MNVLYPPLMPYAEHRLPVAGGHELQVEECGSLSGYPVLFLHGGPGSGCSADHRRFFDPDHYRIVLTDQRGCGRSSPPGETHSNTTAVLVRDLETIRTHLGIDRWLLFGGSWGATLALAYAQKHPHAVSGLVLRGTFLARPQDLDWFFGTGGVARVLPDAATEFRRLMPPHEQVDPVGAYHRRVFGDDEAQALQWAQAWTAWCAGVATWNLSAANRQGDAAEDPRRILTKVRIETHYAVNRYFLAEQPLMQGMHCLPDVPVSIVHGRRDVTCPLEASWSLHGAIRGSRLTVLPESGHLAGEPAMVDALVGETNRLRGLLG